MNNAFARNRPLWIAGSLTVGLLVLVFIAGWLFGRGSEKKHEAQREVAAAHKAHVPELGDQAAHDAVAFHQFGLGILPIGRDHGLGHLHCLAHGLTPCATR